MKSSEDNNVSTDWPFTHKDCIKMSWIFHIKTNAEANCVVYAPLLILADEVRPVFQSCSCFTRGLLLSNFRSLWFIYREIFLL